MPLPRRSRALALIPLVALLSACSGTLEDTIDEYLPKREPLYKSSKRLPPLEIPPDLNRAAINDTLPVPALGDGTRLSEYRNPDRLETQRVAATSVLPDFTHSRIERAGDERWLVVDAPPSLVWPRLRDFWLEQGFVLELEDPSIGIMETDWAEERANLRSGAVSRLLSSLSSALYGAATRDRFRTRVERGAQPAVTEIYVSHRGAEEIVSRGTPGQQHRTPEETKVWQPRPSDPGLEAEMLARMLVFFGVAEQRATQMVATQPTRPDRAVMLREDNGASVLSVAEDFSRAWRRTGLALDRVGFTVEDRDRSRGLYYVRYVDPDQDLGNKDEGFLSKLKFWGDDERPEQTEYLISLIGGEASTQVVVLDKAGEREVSRTADRILGLLHEQLR
ncbi:MAG: outer membrane protein assembly factor BamC [Ectothiorhodospiraceae bacterium]|nr:outer membrane protein assembly factor BamC [Chromatiales bacterium]MCP5154984.1 outer membrane protein assembly factor BamC [Ectothiorhodospiraceae bacterium]